MIVGVLAVIGVALTVRQRTVADKRAQAWQRIAWCLDHTTSTDNATAALRWNIYATVTDSSLISSTEEDVLVAVADRALRHALAQPPKTEDAGTQIDQQEGPL